MSKLVRLTLPAALAVLAVLLVGASALVAQRQAEDEAAEKFLDIAEKLGELRDDAPEAEPIEAVDADPVVAEPAEVPKKKKIKKKIVEKQPDPEEETPTVEPEVIPDDPIFGIDD